MKAWHNVVVFGFVAALAGTACTVTSDNGKDFGDGGGGSSTGGTSSTGGSGGDTSGTGGSDSDGGSTGGTSSTGGSGGGGNADICDDELDPEAGCSQCFQARCTAECNECPDGSVCATQLICIQDCTAEVYDQFGVVEDMDIEDCANDCIGDAGDIAIETNDALACIRTPLGDSGVTSNCGLQCLNVP